MNVLVNALSVTNQSGLHVLVGHLQQVIPGTKDVCRFTVVARRRDAALREALGDAVEWVAAPEHARHWAFRSAWEQTRLPGIARRLGSDVYFTPAGTAVRGLRIPQVVFCQNPWCLVPSLPRRIPERIKAAIQRRVYAIAVRRAHTMVFNSGYMRDAYEQNARGPCARSRIVYQAISEQAWEAARNLRMPREPCQIVSVSAMAPHKGADVLVMAAAELRDRGLRPKLVLVGSWPDSNYERRVRSLVLERHMEDHVSFAGHVPDAELWRLYASSRAFCLMSRCESFGIPAVEAQAFGTPVVSSNCCAIPEICGRGGRFVPPRDVHAVADELHTLLTDEIQWEQASERARGNAAKYHWESCSRPLIDLFLELGASAGA